MGTLWCLQKEMAIYRHWSVSLWRDPDDVPHCRILSLDKTEWRLISATLCGWRRCIMSNQLWFMTRIREEVWHFTPYPLNEHIKTAEQYTIIQQYGDWPLLLHFVQWGGPGRVAAPSSPLLAVPNVTATSAPTSYYHSTWHYNYLCTVKV